MFARLCSLLDSAGTGRQKEGHGYARMQVEKRKNPMLASRLPPVRPRHTGCCCWSFSLCGWCWEGSDLQRLLWKQQRPTKAQPEFTSTSKGGRGSKVRNLSRYFDAVESALTVTQNGRMENLFLFSGVNSISWTSDGTKPICMLFTILLWCIDSTLTHIRLPSLLNNRA